MVDVVITGTGLYVPEGRLDNEQLVAAFNAYVDTFNAENAPDIEAGTVEALAYSSVEFIEKASGIKARHLIEATGPADVTRMKSHLPEDAHGSEDKPSVQAAMAIEAAKQAMDAAGVTADEIDNVICSSASPQRYFPAMSIEVQYFLGIKGTASDMVMGCSSATYAMIAAVNAIKAGTCDRVLMVNPEIFSSMVNYKDRDSHFIFGDIADAVILERADLAEKRGAKEQWLIRDTKSETHYSRNILSHFGPLTKIDDDSIDREDMFFVQQGRKVFKELLPLVTEFIGSQLQANNLTVDHVNRMWLHQANINMNNYAAKKLLGRDPSFEEAPTVLQDYGNIAGAGSVVAFHKHREDLSVGSRGLICSFGAGYSIGSLLVERIH